MRRLLAIFLVISLGNLLSAQNSQRAARFYDEGMKSFRMKEYEDAVKYMASAIKAEKDFLEPYFMLGEIFFEQKRFAEAVDIYRQIVSVDPDYVPEVYLYLSELELKTGDYTSAAEHSRQYLEYPNRKAAYLQKAERINGQAQYGIRMVAQPVPFSPVNLGEQINTDLDEYWPTLTADEQTLIFTVLLPVEGSGKVNGERFQEDFFISTMTENGWSKARNAGPPLNTSRNEGAQSITSNGNYMFFTACNRTDGLGSCDIYMSRKTSRGWSVPVNLGQPVNSFAWEAQPSISADGRSLYFVSNRAGGKGKMDIYRSDLLPNGTWSRPVNLGDTINTPEDDTSPYIHQDNQTLYFSSAGHQGLGGLDIFKTVRKKDGNWIKPQNIGYPINTWFDEAGFIVNARGDMAYFSSDRLKGKRRDIFRFLLYPEARPVPVSYMKGTVFDKDNNQRLVARFELIDLETSVLTIEEISDQNGEFLVCLPVNHDYALNVSREGYLFYSENFRLTGENVKTDPFLKDVPLTPIRIGGVTILNNVFFEFDSYILLEESRIELDKLVLFLQAYPDLRVELGGHTDAIGSEQYNKILSENRAAEVYNYLTENGIDQRRLRYKGYGEAVPIDTNDTEEGRSRNRRTELKIIEIK